MPEPDFDDFTKLSLAKLIAKTVTKYFQDESHRAEFEKWYLETYGSEYVWKWRGSSGNEKQACGDQ